MDEEATKRYCRPNDDGSKLHQEQVSLAPPTNTCRPHSSTYVTDRPRPPVLKLSVCLFALLFGVVWSITGQECLPGGNLFGLVILFICSVLGGKLVGLIQLPTLPPFPPLLGMLLAGLVLRNVPYITDAVFIDTHWSAALRNIALSIILTRAGLGLDPSALRRLKAVCVRLAIGPCVVEACCVAVVSHLLLGLPWTWGFILGNFSLSNDGFSCSLWFCVQGIPTLLMAAGSFDDILAITGFSTCLGIAFSTGLREPSGLLEVVGGVIAGLILGLFLVWFPSRDQEDLVLRRTLMLLGLSIFSVFFSHVIGFAGAGGLCTLVLSFLAALGWKTDKAPVAALVGQSWDVFQPLLFGLIGAEITIATLNSSVVQQLSYPLWYLWSGLGMACILIGLVIRLLVTFLLVHYGGFNLKEKFFIAVAWLPKATVQAAIGSKALDMAREEGDEVLMKFGLDVLTLAVLAILTTAPIGALGIGLAGPRLLARQVKGEHTNFCRCSRFVQDSLFTVESSSQEKKWMTKPHLPVATASFKKKTA
uniref:Sodium/hydrogen exchanger 9B2-like n=1 Tax=Acanthochromis polyacanthus TaxID=80966 RepID=A0A3Q1EV12_9TELE